MKTKIFLAILILITAVKSANGQNYPPLLNNSCWYIDILDFTGIRPTWIIPQKDTVIGSFTYKKYVDSLRKYKVDYIREDVFQKKVFKYVINYGEIILFDFSLHISDTTTLILGFRYVVIADDSITISPGKKRRKLTLNSVNPGLGVELWIEGVGSYSHPLRNVIELPSDPSYRINCSYQNGNAIFNGALLTGCTPPCCPTPPKIGETKITYSKWVPNPFNSSTTFHSDKDLKNVTLTVYNVSGQKVKEIKNISGTTITLNRDNLPGGLYIVRLMQENTSISTAKLLVLNN